MSFKDRISVADEFSAALFNSVKQMGFHVALNGAEHTHPDFVNLVKQSTDTTSLMIRFQPDGVASIGRNEMRSFYLEAKNSNNIEKTAYEQYMNLYKIGGIVVIAFGKLGWGFNFIEYIKLINGSDTVSKYDEHKRFPVIDEWITPRGSNRWDDVRQAAGQASGTPYREVAAASLIKWVEFKRTIIARLAKQ